MFNLAWRDKCALIALILALLACTQSAAQTGAAKPSPVGTWEIKGNDAAQTTWIGSMVLTAGDKGAITGHIDWFASGCPVDGASGREVVRATYQPENRVLTLKGERLEQAERITLGHYTAGLSEDGNHLKGRWTSEGAAGGWTAKRVAVSGSLRPIRLVVDGAPREAILYTPENSAKTPTAVVFVFHEHGGTATKAVTEFNIHEHWPEAISVYMQGVPTPSGADPNGKHNGWQSNEGDVGDRDLKFFDAVLARLRKNHNIDPKRIYSTGISNGGFFTVLLWSVRGDQLAAVSLCACHARSYFKGLKPKACQHIAGENDQTVKFEVQEKSMELVRALNGCDGAGEKWSKGPKATGTLYPSKTGTPFVWVVHPGGHEVPQAGGRLIARFFKENATP